MRISGQDVFGLLGSLCNLYRIHFYPKRKRIAQAFSPPHSLATPLFTLVIIAKVVVLKTLGPLILLASPSSCSCSSSSTGFLEDCSWMSSLSWGRIPLGKWR